MLHVEGIFPLQGTSVHLLTLTEAVSRQIRTFLQEHNFETTTQREISLAETGKEDSQAMRERARSKGVETMTPATAVRVA